MSLQAFFLPVNASARFCLFHEATGPVRGAFVCVQAFAEEMNLSRRMVALQSRALADAGYAVLQIDLYGCGDSAGEFGAADWQTWVQDIVAAADWLRQQTGLAVGLWGVRAGCLLAAAAAREMHESPGRLLFWQPVISGEAYWRQFLRLRLAADIMAGQQEEKLPVPEFDASQPLEVAGYQLSPALVQGLSAARLDLPAVAGVIACLEVNGTGEGLAPALVARSGAWQQAGWQVRSAAVKGESFWQIPEATDCLALLAATTHLLAGSDHGR